MYLLRLPMLKIETAPMPALELPLSEFFPRTSTDAQGFVDFFDRALGVNQFGMGTPHQINEIQRRALLGHQVAPRELLLLQVQMGRFNVQVELVSRLAESATSTIKRLQNG